ncbi:MAG: type II toxin-antitoxin system Phd/YefM family antitoxin [Chloroflexi bacterium]|nr:type II toxin-antitoxin system Phd/YefM family antitoxin [Chloroflexota bacterium]
MTTWQLQDVKNRFSAVVDDALTGEPQEVTRRGKPVVVVVAFEDYQRLCKSNAENEPSFVDHLLAIHKAVRDDGFELPARTRDYTPRAVDF